MSEVVNDPASPLCKRVHLRTVQALAKQDKIPGVVRIGRKLFVTESGLRRFIAAGGARGPCAGSHGGSLRARLGT